MAFSKLTFQPGVNKETTSYSNNGGWFDCDKVRFRSGFPEKIGGWQKVFVNSFLGSCRKLHAWRALDDSEFIGVGTHLKYYVEEGGGFYDVTPLRLTTSAGDVTFAATNGSSDITVTETAHAAVQFDFITFSGAASLGGNITADILNQEYQITEILTANTYKIQARAVATISEITINGVLTPTLVAASGSDSGNGGGSTVGNYQINTGLDTSVVGTGWGVGPYSRGTWGSAASISLVTDKLRLWSHDNFGEDLIINVRNGGVFYWDRSASSSSFQRAVPLSSLGGASNTPTIAKQILVTGADRHVIAFGANTLGTSVQNPLLIRFSDQEDVTDWTPTASNTAGDLIISSGSEIIQAVETRQQVAVFTDKSLHTLQFIGPPFTFGLSLVSENITIMGPNAAVAVDDSVFWMGKEDFYVFSGTVKKLPCTVKDYVFSDFNLDQKEKVFASVNSSFAEIWWFYPSSSSNNIDRYVIYNYEQDVWYFGTLTRTAWIDRGVDNFPIAAGDDGFLYFHETGFDDGSTTPSTAISSYIESSQFEIAEGEDFMFVDKLIPDITFRDSTASSPSVTMDLKTRNYAGSNYSQTDSSNVTKVASVPVEQFTEKVSVRLRGRSLTFKISSSDTGVGWRLGSPRIQMRQDGRR
jgi:hypothetical protein